MTFDRKPSPRLKGCDYHLAGAYFVTICTAERACLFGEIADEEVQLNLAGEIVRAAWEDLPNHYPQAQLDEFIIMPNHHIHGIVILSEDDVGGYGGSRSDTRRDRFLNLSLQEPIHKRHGLSEIIRGFKTWSARRVNEIQDAAGTPVWQRSFYDHIVRSQKDLHRVRRYIRDNPLKWTEDKENPINYKG